MATRRIKSVAPVITGDPDDDEQAPDIQTMTTGTAEDNKRAAEAQKPEAKPEGEKKPDKQAEKQAEPANPIIKKLTTKYTSFFYGKEPIYRST